MSIATNSENGNAYCLYISVYVRNRTDPIITNRMTNVMITAIQCCVFPSRPITRKYMNHDKDTTRMYRRAYLKKKKTISLLEQTNNIRWNNFMVW